MPGREPRQDKAQRKNVQRGVKRITEGGTTMVVSLQKDGKVAVAGIPSNWDVARYMALGCVSAIAEAFIDKAIGGEVVKVGDTFQRKPSMALLKQQA